MKPLAPQLLLLIFSFVPVAVLGDDIRHSLESTMDPVLAFNSRQWELAFESAAKQIKETPTETK